MASPLRHLKRVAVDLDGTIAKSIWTPQNPTYNIGPPLWENVRKLEALVEAGYKPYIYTARPDEHVYLIEEWLESHNIYVRGIDTGKKLRAIYIDDRARHSSAESWLP